MTYSNHHFYGDLSNLNAPYKAYSLQGIGGVTFEGKTLPAIGFPWREGSNDTLDVQARFNNELADRDLCPLLLDGVLGPRTCAAMLTMDDVGAPDGMVATCAQHVSETIGFEPKRCPGGVVTAPPPAEPAPIAKAEKRGEIPVWVWGLGIGVLAVGLAIASKKKKRG